MENKSYPVIDVVATGENIVRLRRQHGVSVSELQRFLGFEAPQAIYKWQQGKCLPSTDNLYALSYFLEVPIEKILVPKFQVLPQDESCGSPFFGKKYGASFFVSSFSRKKERRSAPVKPDHAFFSGTQI